MNKEKVLGLGTWAFGGDYWKKVPREKARRIIKTALDNGVFYFDSAPAYGRGEAEQVLGQALKSGLKSGTGLRRQDLLISTKFFPTLPENVKKGLKRSLSRLILDYIDIYYIHWPNEKCDLPGIAGALEEARKEGLIKALGVSNFSVEQMKNLSRFARIDYCQTGYSLLWRYPEKEIIPWCMENRVKVIGYSPLAQGLLKGRRGTAVNNNKQGDEIHRKVPSSGELLPPAGDSRRKLVFFRDENGLIKTLTEMEKAAEAEEVPLAAAAEAWLKRKEGVTGITAGAGTPLQAEELIRAWKTGISDRLAEKLDLISNNYRQKFEEANPDVENIWDHKR